jgi:hypothetical protein
VNWRGEAACAATVSIALAACGAGHKRYTIVPLRAQQTDLVDSYDILHRRGLRVELTRQTAITSLIEPTVKLSPRAGSRVLRGSTVRITPEHGPIGSPAVLKSNPHYRVPNFAGQLASVAIRWAEGHDMFWAIPELPALPASDAPHLFDAYRIEAQAPTPGNVIVQGVMVGRGFKPTPLTLKLVRR